MYVDEGLSTPFKKACKTRWLVQGPVMNRILSNWDGLQVYFSNLANSPSLDNKVKAKTRIIESYLIDPANRLYFEFLCPIIAEYERLNAMFQQNNPNIALMVRELTLQLKSIKDRIYYPDGKPKEMIHVSFGAKFKELCRVHETQNPEMVLEIQKRCRIYLEKVLEETQKRVAENMETMVKITKLSPNLILDRNKEIRIDQLPFPQFIDDISTLECQLMKIKHINWAELMGEEDVNDATKFWAKVSQYTIEDNSTPFTEVATYFLNLLSLPVSSAFVERCFSLVTYVKDKYSNRLNTKTLDSILRLKSFLHARNVCCKDLEITQYMLNLFNSQNMNKTVPSDDKSAIVENLCREII